MIGRATARLHRLPALAAAFSAPGLAVLAALGWRGMLAPSRVLIGGAIILVSTAILIAPFAIALAEAREALDALGADAQGQPALRPMARGLVSGAKELRFAALRLARLWRARVAAAEARAAAAEAVVAAVPDPLILLDDRRLIVRSNAPAGAFIGADTGPRDLAAALRNPAVLAAADAVLRGEPASVVEFAVAVPVERQLRARFARIAGPSLDGAVAALTLHDITELKRAEQMRADFIANASHELRTPLATLTGFIETLLGPARDDADARERFLAVMRQQAGRMTRLVEDLLSLSRIELKEHVMPQDRVALAPLLADLAEALELRAGERGMRICVAVPGDLPDVFGDRDELAQLFQNLLDNAIKYGRAGTEISVAAEISMRPRVEQERLPTRSVSVAVRDRGDGIAREQLPRLTERFYRIDTARSREMGGTGLGLAIVKHIVNRHRGALDIQSTPGLGSVFTVHLRPHPAATSESASATSGSGDARNIPGAA
jgi:two-component system, OmpR family, phosphate regulon sensor histidine kinase PhoR